MSNVDLAQIALELVKIEKQYSIKPTTQQEEAIELYEKYLDRVYKAYNKANE